MRFSRRWNLGWFGAACSSVNRGLRFKVVDSEKSRFASHQSPGKSQGPARENRSVSDSVSDFHSLAVQEEIDGMFTANIATTH